MSSSVLQSTIRPLRIGMLGAGVVGGGVYEIIMNRLGGSNSIITKICVRDSTKSRDFAIDPATTVVTDVNSIVNDDEIDLIVEVMGRVGIAKDAVMESLRQGKSVVTANSTSNLCAAYFGYLYL